MARAKKPSYEEPCSLFELEEPSSESSTALPTPSREILTSTEPTPDDPSRSKQSAVEKARQLFSSFGLTSGKQPAPSSVSSTPKPKPSLSLGSTKILPPITDPVAHVREALSDDGPGYVRIRSGVLGEIVLWVRDEETVVPDSEEVARYTWGELETLAEAGKDDLRRLHGIKQQFVGTFYGPE